MVGGPRDRGHPRDQPAAADRRDEGVYDGRVLEHFDRGRARPGDHPTIVERMNEGVAALALQHPRVRVGGIERVALQDDRRAVALGLHHLHRRGVGGHHDRRGDPEPARVIGEALRVIARRRRDHARGARLVGKLEQGVERAALLVGGGELEIFELEVDRRAGQLRKRAADECRRADDRIANSIVRGVDVFDRDGKRVWRSDSVNGHDGSRLDHLARRGNRS